MGHKLDAFMRRQEEARRAPLVQDLVALAHCVSGGYVPATVGLHNRIRSLLQIPCEDEPRYVEIAPGTTWEDLLVEFDEKRHRNSRGIDERVRSLVPQVRPGIYQISTWSDRSGESVVRRQDVARVFASQDSRGLYAPVLRYLLDHAMAHSSVWYALAPHKIEGRVRAPRSHRFYMCAGELGFDQVRDRGDTVGRELFVGARFVE